jgi:low affinity Fe/Cu permease
MCSANNQKDVPMTTLRQHGPAPHKAPSSHNGNEKRHASRLRIVFDHFAGKVTQWTGSPFAFGMATGAVLVWLACGPVFHYSETWQLVINTGTTIITFLMVFLIQQSQNKDSHAIHLKLDELLWAAKDADNSLVDIEALDENEMEVIAKRYQDLAEHARSTKQSREQRRMERRAGKSADAPGAEDGGRK